MLCDNGLSHGDISCTHQINKKIILNILGKVFDDTCIFYDFYEF